MAMPRQTAMARDRRPVPPSLVHGHAAGVAGARNGLGPDHPGDTGYHRNPADAARDAEVEDLVAAARAEAARRYAAGKPLPALPVREGDPGYIPPVTVPAPPARLDLNQALRPRRRRPRREPGRATDPGDCLLPVVDPVGEHAQAWAEGKLRDVTPPAPLPGPAQPATQPATEPATQPATGRRCRQCGYLVTRCEFGGRHPRRPA